MAVQKVLGIETEYGVSVSQQPDANPITASSVLINAYLSAIAGRVDWDFVDESPGNDARGFSVDGSSSTELETHLVNAVLTNGARLYVDHAHPEYSSPECVSPLEAVRYDKAGEYIMRRAMSNVKRISNPAQEIVVYKNNSDRKGNSYGCHENYLMDRAVPFSKIVSGVIPFFVTRQVVVGAGKVGSEFTGRDVHPVPFQISQRADFFEEEVGLETTLKRPIVNTRDEPHSDGHRYRRLHVIVGDANLSETSTWLKLGMTATVLSMIEDGFVNGMNLTLAHPVHALRDVSWDPTLKERVMLSDGRKMRAIEIQIEYLERATKYAEAVGYGFLGREEEGPKLFAEWERVLDLLMDDPAKLSDTLDWVAKRELVAGYADRHGLAPDDARLAAIDLQYHDVRPAKSLFSRLPMRTLLSEEEVIAATTEPPTETRAYFRGTCLSRFPESVAAANWDSLIFDLGQDPLRRVPMMDPLRGTKKHVGELFERVQSAAELVEALGS